MTAPIIQRFYAKNCTCLPVELEEARAFIDKHHRARSASLTNKIVSIGLYGPGQDLLAIAQFCFPRTAGKRRKYTTELLRLAFRKDVRVVGGASKLISHYKSYYSPADIFTYQDATGEATDVYAHCGFTLVSQAKKKSYLVAPGKNLETAERGESFSYGEVARRGPDALLGLSLGEVWDAGRRKTNIELFVDELKWHTEETPGDKVWEWVDKNRTYYTYKLTAPGTLKYYFGVSHIKKAKATVEDCLSDRYLGSGGRKLQSWRKKYGTTIEKEVNGLYSTKAEAFSEEARLIGDRHKSDPLCLNHRRGGVDFKFAKSMMISVRECQIHGEAKHLGNYCCSCQNNKRITTDNCSIHGLVKFFSKRCYHCQNQGSVSLQVCQIHDLTKHQGAKCCKCESEKLYTIKTCDEHGESKHRVDTCMKCSASTRKNIRLCETHGEGIHFGDTCARCWRGKTITVKYCLQHGQTKFTSNSCFRCYMEAQLSKRNCSKHGDATHRGKHCLRCMNEKRFVYNVCEKHGKTKFEGIKCVRCKTVSQISEKECSKHGVTKHRGDNCYKCQNEPKIKDCRKHGLTSHRGKSCFKCAREKTASKS